MKKENIKEALSEELQDRLSEEVETLQKLKLSNTVSPLDNPKQIREKRKTIARIRTELQQRNIAGAKANETVNEH